MKTTVRQFAAQGFTLIELLIVVIIIAIMAAIAIPQFGNTAGEATDAALDANLNTVRSAIELYRVQHNNQFPGTVAAADAGAACGNGNKALAANDAATFTAHLTMFSNRAGQVCAVAAPGFIYGPYLRAIPREPVTPVTNAAGNAVALSAVALVDPNAANSGWQYSTLDGRFRMNSNALDRNGQAYFTH